MSAASAWIQRLARPRPPTSATCLVTSGGALHLASVDAQGAWEILRSAPPEELVAAEPTRARAAGRLLVLPDYWLATFTHPFQGSRASLVEAFIAARLRSEQEELAGAQRIFGYAFYDQQPEGQRISVCHLGSGEALSLLGQLRASGIEPHHITAPALLWKKRLEPREAGFSHGGSCILHQCGALCFLYYFHHGQFLFSRSLTLPQGGEGEAALDHLIFELNQSAYLVSQRVKAEVEKLYVAGPDGLVEALAERVPHELSPLAEGGGQGLALPHDLWALEGIDAPTLLADEGLWSITEREVLRERRWRPVQSAGVLLGVGVGLTAAIQGVFVQHWGGAAEGTSLTTTVLTPGEVRSRLTDHRADLEALIAARTRPTVQGLLARLASALPPQLVVSNLDLSIDSPPTLRFQGAVLAQDAAGLVDALSLLRQGLVASFGERLKLDLADFRLGPAPRPVDGGRFAYDLTLEVKLP